MAVLRSRPGRKKDIAFAIREYATKKFSKVLRLLFLVPSTVQHAINTWVAVPKLNVSLRSILFAHKSDDVSTITNEQKVVESTISANCNVLTLGQRCADWFVPRQFRVTGTNTGLIIMSCDEIRSQIGLTCGLEERSRSDEEWFRVLYESWFSMSTCNEAMVRGSATETPALQALQ